MADVRMGVIGVGTIAAALVDAILTGPRAADVDIVLSPRSAHRAAELADRHPAVSVAADNQAVLDESDVVLLAVLPAQVQRVCAELQFRADHVVAGLAAGWPPSVLGPRVSPATTVCQLIPLPMVALRTGPIVLHPAVPAVTALLAGCGEVVVLDRESDVLVLSCVSASMSSYFELQRTLVDWASGKGLRRDLALEYVAALFGGLATESAHEGADRLAHLPVEHETPGGLNEQVRLALTRAGMFDELTRQLDDMHATRRAPPAG